MDSTRLQSVLASAAFYVLFALRFWPVGLLTAIVPAIFVWQATKLSLESCHHLDSIVDAYLRRGGGG